MTESLKHIAEKALDFARQSGCNASRVSTAITSQSSFTVRDNNLDRLNSSTESSLFIQLYINGRYGYFSTNKTDDPQLRDFIKAAALATTYIEPDKYRVLPPKDLLYNQGYKDLGQYDSKYNSISPEEKREIVFGCASEIYDKNSLIISSTCQYDDSVDYYYMADSNGFAGENRVTSFSIHAHCSAKDRGELKPEGWWYERSMLLNQLSVKGCGTKAMERTLEKIGAKKIKSGRYKMILDNNVSSRVVAPIISALNGSAIQQNSSFLINKLGERVFPEMLNIIDRPHLYGYAGSRYFDDEGLATKSMNIVDKGVVTTYFLNTYNAGKLGMNPTIDGPSLLSLSTNGNLPAPIQTIQREAGNGILVTGFNGGNSNTTTGDFSFGIEGFYFENGDIKHPIKEMNITGNIIDLWNRLITIGDDPRKTSGWMVPSILFDSITFNGN